MIQRLAILGVGLIGGSLALALKQAGAVAHVVGAGRSQGNLDVALARGIIDEATTDPVAAVRGADMVVVGATLDATGPLLDTVCAALADDTVVTDVGSTKGSVVAAARMALGARFARFVPGHPIAGTERSGAGAAFAELFRDHRVILTPVAETERSATTRVRDMWAATGAEVITMDVAAHDDALAATSHLPHLLAYSLVDALAARGDGADIFRFAAGGFRDFTRIASSNPAMWASIALANRDALLAACGQFSTVFDGVVAALESGDRASLERVFERARAAREGAVIPESNSPASALRQDTDGQ